MHRLRETGLAPEAWDDLDERCLDLDEIHHLCKMLLLHNSKVELPHPKENWNAFICQLTLVNNEKLQWNPVKRRMMPWINLRKLEAVNPNNKGVVSFHRSHPSCCVLQCIRRNASHDTPMGDSGMAKEERGQTQRSSKLGGIWSHVSTVGRMLRPIIPQCILWNVYSLHCPRVCLLPFTNIMQLSLICTLESTNHLISMPSRIVKVTRSIVIC